MSAMRRFQEIWELVLVQLPEKYSEATINLFFKPLEIAALNDQIAVLVCNSDIKADILNKRHLSFLKQAFTDIFSFPMNVCVLSSEHQTLDYDLLQDMVENGGDLSSFMKGHAPSRPSDAPHPLIMNICTFPVLIGIQILFIMKYRPNNLRRCAISWVKTFALQKRSVPADMLQHLSI